MTTIETHSWSEVNRFSHNFTGLIRVFNANGLVCERYYVDGVEKRDLGPCIEWFQSLHQVHIEESNKRYYRPLDGIDGGAYYMMSTNKYWKLMYERYKGTEHEDICLAYILGAK